MHRPSEHPLDEIAAAMAAPGFYPGALERVEVRETHISWVFLAGERAFKLRKACLLYTSPSPRDRS